MRLHDIRFFLAVAVLMCAIAMAGGLFSVNIPPENKDLINFILGAVSTWSGTVINHYFGDPDKKDKTG